MQASYFKRLLVLSSVHTRRDDGLIIERNQNSYQHAIDQHAIEQKNNDSAPQTPNSTTSA